MCLRMQRVFRYRVACSCKYSPVHAAAAAGCDQTVVAAFYPLAFAAERLAAGEFEIGQSDASGAEPHDFELSARDVERIVAADKYSAFRVRRRAESRLNLFAT